MRDGVLTDLKVISEGCTGVNPTLANCANERGYIFQSNLSTSWSTQGLQNGVDGAIFSLNTYEESFLGLDGNASYGYDTVNLGIPGAGLPSLQKQVIAGFWTDAFFLGSLGLSPVPFNFTNLNDPQPSMLSTLYNQSLIPSRSWGYSAGAHYKNPPVFGTLTLGGYDTTRFTSNSLTLPFGADFSRDLLVSLQSVTYDTAGSSPLLASSIDMFIDSMVSEIWLPVPVCEAFAQQFNLTWNEQGQVYLISNAAHAVLVKQNPTFSFKIGPAGDGGNTVDIVLPYAAFDLNLTAPIVGKDTRYFPLKQAQNSTQYTLGRTFLQVCSPQFPLWPNVLSELAHILLHVQHCIWFVANNSQEAYVIADYERHNFSVSQALFPSTSVPAEIVAIHAIEKGSGTGNGTGSGTGGIGGGGDDNKKKSGLGAGAIAGIAVGGVVVLALLAVAFFLWSRKKKRRHELADTSIPGTEGQGTSQNVVDLTSDGVKLEVEGNKPDVHEVGEQHYLPTEMPGSKPDVHEMNEHSNAAPELPAYDGHWGRHELEQEDSIHELDGAGIAALSPVPEKKEHRRFSWQD